MGAKDEKEQKKARADIVCRMSALAFLDDDCFYLETITNNRCRLWRRLKVFVLAKDKNMMIPKLLVRLDSKQAKRFQK